MASNINASSSTNRFYPGQSTGQPGRSQSAGQSGGNNGANRGSGSRFEVPSWVLPHTSNDPTWITQFSGRLNFKA